MIDYTRSVTAYIPGKNPWTHRIRTFYDKAKTKKRTDGFAIMIKGKLELHGLVTTWHENGHLIKSDQYYKGVQTGTTSMFRIDGTLFGQVSYKNGLKHGYTANFDHDGKKLLNQTMWLNNIKRRDYIYFKENHSSTGKKIINEIIDYYDNKKIKQKSIFNKDFPTATHYIYYPSGNLHYVINEEKISTDKYKGPKKIDLSKKAYIWVLSGPLQIYYPDGILKMKLFYNNDGRENRKLSEYYDSKGMPIHYINDVIAIPNYYEILNPLEIN